MLLLVGASFEEHPSRFRLVVAAGELFGPLVLCLLRPGSLRAIENRPVLGQCVLIIVGDFSRCVLRLHLQDDELEPKRGAPQPELRCWTIVVLILIFVRYRSWVNRQAHLFGGGPGADNQSGIAFWSLHSDRKFLVLGCVLLLFLCLERTSREG